MGMTQYWQDEQAILLSILQKTGLTETTKWGIPVFTYNGRNVVGLAGFKTHFTLWFYNGVFIRVYISEAIENEKKVNNGNRSLKKGYPFLPSLQMH